MDLALNNLQRLICHKTKPNKQTYLIQFFFSSYISSSFHIFFSSFFYLLHFYFIPATFLFRSTFLNSFIFHLVYIYFSIFHINFILYSCSPSFIDTLFNTVPLIVHSLASSPTPYSVAEERNVLHLTTTICWGVASWLVF